MVARWLLFKKRLGLILMVLLWIITPQRWNFFAPIYSLISFASWHFTINFLILIRCRFVLSWKFRYSNWSIGGSGCPLGLVLFHTFGVIELDISHVNCFYFLRITIWFSLQMIWSNSICKLVGYLKIVELRLNFQLLNGRKIWVWFGTVTDLTFLLEILKHRLCCSAKSLIMIGKFGIYSNLIVF